MPTNEDSKETNFLTQCIYFLHKITQNYYVSEYHSPQILYNPCMTLTLFSIVGKKLIYFFIAT